MRLKFPETFMEKQKKMIGQEFDEHVITKNGYFVEYAKNHCRRSENTNFVTGGYRDRKEMEDWLNRLKLLDLE